MADQAPDLPDPDLSLVPFAVRAGREEVHLSAELDQEIVTTRFHGGPRGAFPQHPVDLFQFDQPTGGHDRAGKPYAAAWKTGAVGSGR